MSKEKEQIINVEDAQEMIAEDIFNLCDDSLLEKILKIMGYDSYKVRNWR